VPGYLEAVDALKALGIDEVIIFCVNDGAVMQAWARDQGVEGSDLLTMMGPLRHRHECTRDDAHSSGSDEELGLCALQTLRVVPRGRHRPSLSNLREGTNG